MIRFVFYDVNALLSLSPYYLKNYDQGSKSSQRKCIRNFLNKESVDGRMQSIAHYFEMQEKDL